MGNGLGLPGENIIWIKLEFGDYEEEISWDVSNPENCPTLFAHSLVNELNLDQNAIFVISHQINQQIKSHFTAIATNFAKSCR